MLTKIMDKVVYHEKEKEQLVMKLIKQFPHVMKTLIHVAMIRHQIKSLPVKMENLRE